MRQVFHSPPTTMTDYSRGSFTKSVFSDQIICFAAISSDALVVSKFSGKTHLFLSPFLPCVHVNTKLNVIYGKATTKESCNWSSFPWYMIEATNHFYFQDFSISHHQEVIYQWEYRAMFLLGNKLLAPCKWHPTPGMGCFNEAPFLHRNKLPYQTINYFLRISIFRSGT